MSAPTLLAVPNFSEGRDEAAIARIGQALSGGGDGAVRLLDVHSDPDHHRSVFTLAGPPEALLDALLAGAAVAFELIDVVSRARRPESERGQHPHVGAIDVAPIVYPRAEARGAACATALVLADRLASEQGVPVFLYGELTRSEEGAEHTRAELRRGGVEALAARMEAAGAGQEPGPAGGGTFGARVPLHPDFGGRLLHPRAGAALVAARAPLVAFNLQLAPPATLEDARAIAARIREGGSDGLAGLRAIGVEVDGGVAQVSMNVERPSDLALAAVVDAVAAHAPVASAELVGLAPAAAMRGFPEELPMEGFDPARHIIENALGC
jgi:glutamate formiminotransferase / 5-formyltetrahydrofolate cyclo-ligase